MGYGTVILFYIINFFWGRQKNESIAKAWYVSVPPKKFVGSPFPPHFCRAGEMIGLTRSQFSRVGDMRTGEVGIVKETQSTFLLRAAGRVHCQGLEATLKVPLHLTYDPG